MKTSYFSKDILIDKDFQKIAHLLKKGEVIAFPTETVYGLGAYAFDQEAIEKIYQLKNRPKSKSLIVHIGQIKEVEKVAKDIPSIFYLLADKFFPGPLTIILKKKDNLPTNISSDSTIAVRMPDNKLTLRLLKCLQDPIVGTSANITDRSPPTSVNSILNDFNNKIAAIIDDGKCPIGVPSTILNLASEPYSIIREGSMSKELIEEVLQLKLKKQLQ